MLTIMRYSLKRSLGQILGWGLSLALLAVYIVLIYDAFSGTQEQYMELLKVYPPELMAAFGGTADLFSPPGYLNFTFFSYTTLVIGFYAVLAGSGLLVEDEENGKLDLVLAHPIRRSEFFFGRVLAMILTVLSMLVITWLGFVATIPSTTLEINPVEMALPLLDLFLILLLFGALALLLSMLLPSRRMAATWAGLALVGSYFITTLARLDEKIKAVEKFSPLHYSKGGYAIQGLEWDWVLGLAGLAVICIVLAWWRFERRDIRVAGEGGWRLPFNRKGAGVRNRVRV